MLTKNWKSLAVLCALTLSLTAGQTQAASIGIDINDARSTGGTLAPGDSTGALPQVNWTTITAAQTTGASNLKDDSGAATTLDISWDQSNSGSLAWQGQDQGGSSFSGGTPANDLFDGLFSNSTTDTPQITISSIPYATYDLYAYFGADFCCGTRGGSLSTGIGGEPEYGVTGGASSTFDLSTTLAPAMEASTNYALWNDLSATSMTLTYTPQGGSGQVMAFGFQIVDTTSVIPEPSTLALSGIGLLGLLVCGRRRRRRA